MIPIQILYDVDTTYNNLEVFLSILDLFFHLRHTVSAILRFVAPLVVKIKIFLLPQNSFLGEYIVCGV